MSISFSSTTNKNGILQRIERELGFSDGYITGNTTRLAQWTGDVNLAHDDALAVIYPVGGRWQFDDSNHDDFPFITTNLISGQRDYTFTADGSGNIILDVYRVMIADSGGIFREIKPIDQLIPNSNDYNTDSFIDGRNTGGTPTRYSKEANGIFLDPIPNYNYTLGLKVFINREGSYFTVSDTTKKPGIAGLFHEYYVINPAYKYASVKLEPRVTNGLLERKLRLEEAMRVHYGQRERDVRGRIIPNIENNK